jgi:hypothetical protein
MSVAMSRTHLGAGHTLGGVLQFVDVSGLDRLGETWPATPRFKFVGRGEQWFPGYDVDVDARFLVIQIFAGSGNLGAALLGDAILFGR